MNDFSAAVSRPKFVYVTYIRTTPEKLWRALTEPEFTRQYWGETWQDCDWKPGSSWKLMIPDGRVADAGKIWLVNDAGHYLPGAGPTAISPTARFDGYGINIPLVR